jgi:CRP/FNR family transcriptional regulator, anaerobic regulatory protein
MTAKLTAVTSELPTGSPCAACPVRELAICEPLEEADLPIMDLYKSGDRTVPAGTDFIRQGEPVNELFTLLDGWAFHYRLLEDGRRQITRVLLPGDFIGFQAELGAPAENAAQALTDCRFCVFPQESAKAMISEQPELAIRLIWTIARDEARVEELLTSIGRRSARERVALFLLELYYRVRLRDTQPLGSEIPLPLTQEHIGDALGLTSVHVNRTLRELREAGLLVVSKRTLQILDPDGLVIEAGYDPEQLGRLKP